MHAVLRMNTFDPAKLAASTAQLEEFDRTHASQPGYAGSITVDLGGGRRMTVNLWKTEEDGKAAFAHLRQEVDRLLTPLMSAPSEFLGAGPVVAVDLPSTTDG